jgi:uncharacterized protein (DUF305 family)
VTVPVQTRQDGPARQDLPRGAAVALVVVAVAIGLAAGLLVAGAVLRPAAPSDTSPEAGFARDMQAHHAQAVEMSVLVRERSQDEEVRILALDILLTQQQQQGQMFGWLETWGLPQAPAGPPMAWAGEQHGHGAGAPDDPGMPGMLTQEELDSLRDADGAEANRVYLSLMIPHHAGGVEMAEAVLDRSDHPAVRRLASSIVTSQQAEIDLLAAMLEERGGAPD